MEESLKMGVFIRSLGSTIVVIPPLAICKKDFAFLLDVIYEITQKIEGMV
jgi:adenosylmethionine-8-amino-7-oxononanoate aminotransferase